VTYNIGMNWITIAIISYLFTAVANTLDKLLLSRFLKAASIYAFYVGILGIISLIFIPFGVIIPAKSQLIISLIGGAGFVAALYLMYSAFLKGEATKVATIVGGSLPIYTFILSKFFLGEELKSSQLIALAFLVVGIFVMGYEKKAKKSPSYLWRALLSGLVFSVVFVVSKYVYSEQPFISGFFWMRIGAFLGAAALLLVPNWRQEILKDIRAPKKSQSKSKSLLLFNQVIGALGFILLNYAISLGSVTLINAMQGLQYVFVFIIAAVMGKKFKELSENYSPLVIFQKTLAIFLIIGGLVFLAI
jgi:drug/metabolite transporter (DMT)-like permease